MFPPKVYAMVASCDNETRSWHLHYGHLNINGLQLLSRKEMERRWFLDYWNLINLTFCEEGYVYGKQSKNPILAGKLGGLLNVLKLVHTDLCWPINTKSLAEVYFFFFKDYGWLQVYELHLSFGNEVRSYRLKKFKAQAKRQGDPLIKTLWTNGVREFVSTKFKDFDEENGVYGELIAPYTPE